MRNKLIVLLSALLCISAIGAKAQWYIQLNGGTTTTHLCEGLSTGSVLVRVYNGATNMTASCSVYESVSGAISPTGSGGLIVGPGYTPALGTGASYGPVTLTAYYSGSVVATYNLTIVPWNEVLAGAVTGPVAISSTGVFTLNTGVPFVSTTNLTWSVSNGLQNAYYTGSGTGTTYTVTPLPYAPMFTPSVFVRATFEPSSNSCGLNSGATANLGRNPVISSTLPYNIFCGGSTVLTSNMEDCPWYPSDPVLQTMAHRSDAHFTFAWYEASAPSVVIGTSNTLTVSAPGTYYLTVAQYNLVLVGSTYQFSTTSAGSKTSNSIVISAPAAGTPTPTFKVNGMTPTPTQTASTPAFLVCQGRTVTLNGSASTGPIHNYTIEVNGTQVAAGVSAPPSSFDLTPYFATSGFYLIKMTVNSGCPASNMVYQGYIKINIGAPPANSISVNVTVKPSYTITTYGPTLGNVWTAPVTVGRYATNFLQTPTYGTTSTACNYQVLLYSVSGTGTETLLWTSATNTTACTTATLPVVPITYLNPIGGTPFFISPANAPNGSLWAIDFILGNDCGIAHNKKYFNINDVLYLKSGETGTSAAFSEQDGALQLSPVPFANELTINLSLEDDAATSLAIYSIDGRFVTQAWNNEQMSKGSVQKTINTANWAAGMYFYKFVSNGKLSSGKIVKQ